MSFVLKKVKSESLKFLLFPLIVGIVIAFAGIIISSIFYLKYDENILVKILPYLFFALSGFICGHLYKRRTQGKGIIKGFVSGLVLSVISFIIFAIFNKFNVNIHFLLSPLLQIMFSCFGGIEAANIKNEL